MRSLRPLEPRDLDAVHALISRMDVVRHMSFPLCSREQSENFVRESIAESPTAPWRSVVRAIVDDESSSPIGLCGLVIVRGTEEAELWYLVAPDFWGRGIATEAAGRLLTVGFRELGLHRIWATCLPENPASVRVLEKIGMRREGFLVRNQKIHGEWKDSILYAIVADEFAAADE